MGSIEKRLKVRDKLSAETFKEMKARLETYGVTSLIRPTGFGKSYILSKITSLKKNGKYVYNKCLYIYPLDIIKKDISMKYGKDSEGVSLHNTDFISYRGLKNVLDKGYTVKKTGEVLTIEEYISQYDLVMCDECHICGSKGFMDCWERIGDLFGKDKIHLIGVTASPNRMDGTDVIENFFGGTVQEVKRMTDIDAFNLGLLEKPYWIIPIYNKEEFKQSVLSSLEGKGKLEDKDKKDLLLKLNNIENMSTQIYKVLDQFRPGSLYFKFIVFYVNITALASQREMVHNWFEDAYSKEGFKVHDHILVSSNGQDVFSEDDTEMMAGFKEISSLTEKDYRIDLIHCVDMLNMGYHVDDITGVIMLRGTRSEIVQIQQVGRCYSVNAKYPPIIFDCVNNAGTKKWFKNSDNDELTDMSMDINQTKAVSGSDNLREYRSSEGIDVIADGFIINAMKEVQRLSNKKEYENKLDSDSIKFWYTKLKAPLYIVAYKHGQTCAEMLQTLKTLGISVKNEDIIEETLTEYDKIKSIRDERYRAREVVYSLKGEALKGRKDSKTAEIKLKVKRKRSVKDDDTSTTQNIES